MTQPDEHAPLTLGDLSESELLARIFPIIAAAGEAGVLLGPGDDTALLAAPTGAVLATTDTLVRGQDWRDEWSTGHDVGVKAVAQNVADIAAMGGRATGLLLTLVACRSTSVAWVEDFARGVADAAADAGVPVVGGDLSGADEGVLMVSVTALGELAGAPAITGRSAHSPSSASTAADGTEGSDAGRPVTRSGARVGDIVAVTGTLGHAAAGLALLMAGADPADPALAPVIGVQRAPRPPYEQGPIGRAAGAHAMIDLSDGLGRDAGRIAAASGVRVELEPQALAADIAALAAYVDPATARECVLRGGEDHALLACYPPQVDLPDGWRRIGAVVAGSGVGSGRGEDGGGEELTTGGWDHFG